MNGEQAEFFLLLAFSIESTVNPSSDDRNKWFDRTVWYCNNSELIVVPNRVVRITIVRWHYVICEC